MTGSFLSFLIDIVFGFVELILFLELILRFLGANAAAPFVTWIYETANSFMVPFSGIFPPAVLRGRYVVDTSALFALIIYALIAFFLREIIDFITTRKNNYAERYDDREDIVEEKENEPDVPSNRYRRYRFLRTHR